MKRYPTLVLVVILVVAAGFAFVRYDQGVRAYKESSIGAFSGTGQAVTFQAYVVSDVERTRTSTRVVVDPEFAHAGRVLLFLGGVMNVAYGDRVQVTGMLENPGSFDEFNYANFLLKDGVYAVMYGADIVVHERGAYQNVWEHVQGLLLGVKHVFHDVLHKHLAPPESSILAAIVLGDKHGLSEETKERLNRAGVRHITAISGMHVAVLTLYLVPLMVFVGLWRRQALVATAVLMLVFIVFTGLQASAVRAGIMGGVVLLAQYLGRMQASWRALLIAAAGMLVVNPFLLTRDIGFQLSFLAVAGIILFAPLLVTRLPKWLFGREIVAMSLAAQLFTFPVLVYNFGQISLVSVGANILIVPILPFVMGFGFLFLFAGALTETVGFLFSLPVILLLEYLMIVVRVFAALPLAAIHIEYVSPFWLVVAYGGMGFVYWKLRKRKDFWYNNFV